MSLSNNFVDCAIAHSAKQKEMVDNLVEDSPVIAALPMQSASHDVANVYEEILDVTGGVSVDLDDALSDVTLNTKLRQQDLTIVKGLVEVGADKCKRFGSPAAYFAHVLPAILRKTGSDMENSAIYDILKPTALATGNVFDAGGSTADEVNSIIAVRWAGGNAGLYSPKMYGRGDVFESIALSGGAPYLNSSKQMVYGLVMATAFGIQMANTKGIGIIKNVDYKAGTPKVPTALMIDELVSSVRGTPSDTVIYCHKSVYDNCIKSLITRTYSASDNNANASFGNWDGVKIIPSYNFNLNAESVTA